MRRNSQRPFAFTLIELIAVVVALGILAALAVPTFSAVKERSQASVALRSAESVVSEARALAAFNGDALSDTYIDAAGADLENAGTVTYDDTDGSGFVGTVIVTRGGFTTYAYIADDGTVSVESSTDEVGTATTVVDNLALSHTNEYFGFGDLQAAGVSTALQAGDKVTSVTFRAGSTNSYAGGMMEMQQLSTYTGTLTVSVFSSTGTFIGSANKTVTINGDESTVTASFSAITVPSTGTYSVVVQLPDNIASRLYVSRVADGTGDSVVFQMTTPQSYTLYWQDDRYDSLMSVTVRR